MDKFSKITNQKVKDEPELVTNKDKVKLEAIKAGITKLMDSFLTIRSYGGARSEQLMSSVKISGKELFIEALIDFMNDRSIEEQVKVLESLKGNTRDWQVIDNKINELDLFVKENNEFNSNKKQISKIKTLLDTYGDDERFETILENMVAKSNNSSEAHLMSITANKMKTNFKFLNYSRKHLSIISEKYGKKAQELKFKEDVYSNR
jgi:hypothetical protein